MQQLSPSPLGSFTSTSGVAVEPSVERSVEPLVPWPPLPPPDEVGAEERRPKARVEDGPPKSAAELCWSVRSWRVGKLRSGGRGARERRRAKESEGERRAESGVRSETKASGHDFSHLVSLGGAGCVRHAATPRRARWPAIRRRLGLVGRVLLRDREAHGRWPGAAHALARPQLAVGAPPPRIARHASTDTGGGRRGRRLRDGRRERRDGHGHHVATSALDGGDGVRQEVGDHSRDLVYGGEVRERARGGGV